MSDFRLLNLPKQNDLLMNTNEQLISNFYTAFNKLDAAGMNACYSEDIVFYDPVFELLRGDQVRTMWQMLCRNAKDFSLTYGNIKDNLKIK